MLLASVSGSVTHQIAQHGVYAVFVLMAVDAVFPAGSELVMAYAGAIAAGAFSTTVSVFGARVSHGSSAYVVLSVAGTLGYVVGALIGWWIGTRGGRVLVERHGRLIHLSSARLGRAERWFARWGRLGVLLGRVTPLVRSFVSIPAGIFDMPIISYAVLTLIGSSIWAFGIAAIGWELGAHYARFDHGFRYAEYAVLAMAAAAASLAGHRLIAANRQTQS